MPHTDTPLEFAARTYCAAKGLNPDEMVRFDDGSGHLVAMYRYRWKNIADELTDLIARMDALKNHGLLPETFG